MAGLTDIPIGQILTPPPGDIGLQAINTLMPLVQQPNGDVGVSQTLMGVLLSYIGWTCIALMAIVAVVNGLNVLLTSAHDGHLDRRAEWKGVIRWTFAFVGMLPLANGFSAIHGLIYQGAYWGDGLIANSYQTLVQAIGPNATPIFQPPVPGTIKTIAGIVQSEMCRAIANAAGNNPNLVPEPTPITGGAAWGDGYIVWAYRLSNGNATGSPACGAITISQPTNPDPGVANIVQQRVTILTGIIGQIRAGVAPIAKNLWATRKAASLAPLQALVVGQANSYSQQLTAAAQAATAAIRAEFPSQSMRAGSIAMPAGVMSMQNQWITAPAWYIYLSYYDGLTMSATMATPSIEPPSFQGFGYYLSSDMANLIAASTNHLTDIMAFSSTQDRTDAPSGYGDMTSIDMTANDGAGLVTRILRQLNINDKLLRGFVEMASPTSTTIVDPFGQLINLGQYMVLVAVLMIGAAAAFASSTGTAVLTTFNLLTLNLAGAATTLTAHSVFSVLMTPIFFLAMMLLGPGLMLAVLVPLTPAAIWLFGIMNWLVRFAILIIAAPFWMFAHITLDDSGFTSRGINGWYELVAVYFKPIFMLAGLILAFPVFAFCTLLATWMFSIMASPVLGGANLIFGFLGLLTCMSAFVLLIISIAVGCFQLITIVPEKALGFLGAQAASAFNAHEMGRNVALIQSTVALQNIQAGMKALTNGAGPKQTVGSGSGNNANLAAASTP